MTTDAPTQSVQYNNQIQTYRDIQFKLIVYTDKHFARLRAKRFLILTPDGKPSGQNIWIPNSCLCPDGTLDTSKNVAWIFQKAETLHKLELAGYVKSDERKS